MTPARAVTTATAPGTIHCGNAMLADLHAAIDRDGFFTVAGAFSPVEVAAMADGLGAAIAAAANDPAVLGGSGGVYAARNVLQLWPAVAELWCREALLGPLEAILGPDLGLVRALFFDKPPGNSWALPWHKDLTIAVRDNTLPAVAAMHPTRKAGVPHLEAPESVLANMLTARIHLDAVDESNGPLKVAVGSHRDGKALRLDERPVRTLTAAAGDVLLIRPLVAHCSNHSRAGTERHRRIVHLEFAASAELPDGLAWHDWVLGYEPDGLTFVRR